MGLGRLAKARAPWRSLRPSFTTRATRSQPQRRWYASGITQTLTGDLPWAIGAVVFTVPAAAWLISLGPAGESGKEGHGVHTDPDHQNKKHGEDEDSEDSEESHDDDQAAEQQPKPDVAEDNAKDSDGDAAPPSDGSSNDADAEDKSNGAGKGDDGDSSDDGGNAEGGKQGGESSSSKPQGQETNKRSYYKDTNLNGESKSDITGATARDRGHGDDKPVGDKGTREDPKVLEYPDEGEDKGYRKVTYADAKGGYKKRIESPYGRKQGELDTEKEHDALDPAAQSKAPGPPGTISHKQEGVSNTDTKHPYDLESTERSRKGEGGPDTAKLKGTVDPARPQR